ncbi:uncharacterized protein PpBr36_10556 [Pyricularia pennisetigena]|nr:uncharacterized protein PpBr36_10556 [Pyricularia pennisetigena]TLS21278.1 hypothetical protein PpBr36_10556 [Pyricularia pennisetigena]
MTVSCTPQRTRTTLANSRGDDKICPGFDSRPRRCGSNVVCVCFVCVCRY